MSPLFWLYITNKIIVKKIFLITSQFLSQFVLSLCILSLSQIVVCLFLVIHNFWKCLPVTEDQTQDHLLNTQACTLTT